MFIFLIKVINFILIYFIHTYSSWDGPSWELSGGIKAASDAVLDDLLRASCPSRLDWFVVSGEEVLVVEAF